MDIGATYFEKAKAEIQELVARGVIMTGNAFSQVLLVKGEPKTGEPEASERAEKALCAALQALGYAPEDWMGISVIDEKGKLLSPETLRLAVVTLDPATLIALDEPAAQALRETFADELVALEELEAATLAPGVVAHVLGMRVMALGGFAASLDNPKEKQRMWSRLKQLPPLGEPY